MKWLVLALLAACSSSSSSSRSSDGGSANPDLSGGANPDLSPRQVTACDHLPAAGTWEQITPPAVTLPGPSDCTFGVGSFVVDPKDGATVYLGTCNMGIWKSTDCGATWAHVNTGTNGATLDGGRQWTMAIDPVDSQVLYTNSGYGKQSNGAFKSIDGGVNWTQIWPPADAALANVVAYNFVGGVILDPSNSQHLLITFHAACSAPYNQACFGESSDGGATWKLRNGDASWVGGEGQAAWFLDNGRTFLWGSQSNGLWRTSDGGSSWSAVTDKMAEGHGAGQLYRARDGTFYLGVVHGILRSPDGVVWTLVPSSGSLIAGLTGDGTTMWASSGFPWNQGQGPPPYLPFYSASESDGMSWSQLSSPMLSDAGQLAYDADHHILYSSDLYAGFWRVVVR